MALSGALSFLTFISNYLNQCPLYDRSSYQTACDLNAIQNFDFIIVGGGSAGCTLASRLTENPNWNVLLIEAGDVPSLLSEAPAAFLSLQGTMEDWQFKTEPGNYCLGLKGGRCNWPQGKALGGGSTINAMMAIKGFKRDYDEWVAQGNNEWSWDIMQRYFDKAFRQLNTISYESAMPTRKIVLEAAKSLGYPVNIPDLTVGYQDINFTINGNQRHNVAKAYIVSANKRSNLCVMTNALVTRILFDTRNGTSLSRDIFKKSRAIGVVLTNGKQYLAQKEVIISAGAINTPKLLMLSGIGPRAHLESHNIDTFKDLPGVGQNLQDHLIFPAYLVKFPGVAIEANITAVLESYCHTRQGPLGQVNTAEIAWWINTNNKSMSADPNVQFQQLTMLKNDSYFTPSYLLKLGFNDVSTDSIIAENANNTMMTIIAILSKPKSRGHIHLATRNVMDPPLIYPGYLSDDDDMMNMLGAIEHMNHMVGTPSFAGSEVVNFAIPNCDVFKFQSEQYWKCSLRNFGTTLYHPSGTCKMGGDRMAVVDQQLKVRGINNLRVVDASIMPTIVTGNLNTAVVSIAEKISDVIKANYELKYPSKL